VRAAPPPGPDAGRPARAPRLEFLLPDVAATAQIDARVYEQDTELILRQDLVVREPSQTYADLTQQALIARGFKPGSVVVRETDPLQLFAIIHDLGQEPSWREDWIEAALAGVMSVVQERRLASLALPLLGTVHGRLGVSRAAELIALRLGTPPPSLERVSLVVPKAPGPAVTAKLAHVLSLA
jgi:O-acetyl-ADP-ribose deacetylase (regulator of RNase III)